MINFLLVKFKSYSYEKRITPSPVTMILKIIVQTIDNKSSIHKILAFTPSYSVTLLLSVPHWLLGLTSKNSLKKKKKKENIIVSH